MLLTLSIDEPMCENVRDSAAIRDERMLRAEKMEDRHSDLGTEELVWCSANLYIQLYTFNGMRIV